jgi:hypothetical protein
MVSMVLWLFSVMHNFHTRSGTHLNAYCTGTEVFFLGEERPGRDAAHTPPSSAGAKNVSNYASTPPARLRGVCSDNSIFLLLCVVPMVIKVTIDFLITMITLGTTVSDVLMVIFALSLPTLPLIC